MFDQGGETDLTGPHLLADRDNESPFLSGYGDHQSSHQPERLLRVRPLRTIWTRYPHHNHIVVKARRYLQLIRRRQHIGEKTTAGKASRTADALTFADTIDFTPR